jgi:hypothetical protein
MKKYFFSNRLSFLLAIAAMFLLDSCQKSEQAIRAEVEKEIMLKIEASFQTPKNVLSVSDMKIVLAKFKEAKLKLGDTTEITKLAHDVTIYSANGKDLNYQMLAFYDGKWHPALMEGYIPVTALPDFKGRIIKDFCQYTRCPEPGIGGVFQLDPKWEAIANTYTLSQIYAPSLDCVATCESMNCSSPVTCFQEKQKCKADCFLAVLKDIRLGTGH